jgi:hypothetical protein
MDTLSHGIWGYVALHKLRAPIARAGIAAGAAPDLLFFIPSKIEQVGEHGWSGLELGRNPAIWRANGPPLPPDLVEAYTRYYVFSHSLVLLALVVAAGWLLLRKSRAREWLWLAVPYALHIVMDIPTHERYLTQPFFPLSSWQFEGLSWTDPRIFWPHLAILAAAGARAWRARRRRGYI